MLAVISHADQWLVMDLYVAYAGQCTGNVIIINYDNNAFFKFNG